MLYTQTHRHCVKYPHIEVLILFFPQLGYTALLRGVYGGHAEVVRMLLNCGSAVDEVDDVSVHPAPMSLMTVSELTGLKIPLLQ